MLRNVLLTAGALLCVAMVLIAFSGDESAPAVELGAPQEQKLAGAGYLNWLRWSAKLHHGKASASREFERPPSNPSPDFGKMSEAGKVIHKLRQTVRKERTILHRLEKMIKDRKGGKQPESVVVHVGQVGPRGPDGRRGPRGNRGPVGLRGAPGPLGKPGDLGATGRRGNQGPKGPRGRIGDPGRRGLTGKRGARGPEGASGPKGLQGARGFVGARGPPGLQGRNGEEGPVGMPGPRGATGLPGPVGPNGVEGKFILPPKPRPKYALTGEVRNAVDAAAVPTAKITAIRHGKTVATAVANNGQYRFVGLESGMYDIHATFEGFCEFVDTIKMLNSPAVYNINMSPTLAGNQLRVVLTWGEKPSGLDAQLVSPDNCVTNYANKDHCAGVSMDRAVTDSYGPETMTIHVPNSGVYKFRVHNYARVSSNLLANGLNNAPATVTVYKGCERKQFVCGRDGDVNAATGIWEVFNYDGGSGTISR